MNAQLAIVGLLVLLSLIVWMYARERGRVGRGNRHRPRVAGKGIEHLRRHGVTVAAERFLARRGYEVVGRQVTSRWTLWVDDQPHEVHNRADLLVERGGRRYVAEVKTGARAPNPTLPATRRQLMEYSHTFDVDGVLLVDMSAHKIRSVRFS